MEVVAVVVASASDINGVVASAVNTGDVVVSGSVHVIEIMASEYVSPAACVATNQ